MEFNPADLVVIGFLLVSGLWGLMRGLVREVLGVMGWVGAAFATLYGYGYVVPFTRQLISIDVVAQAAAGIGIFLVTLVLLSMVSGAISSRVRDSGFNPLDRTLGFVYGLVRGAVLVCLAYLLLTWAVKPTEDPPWLASARTLPLIQRGAALLTGLVPSDTREQGSAAAERARRQTQKALEAERALRDLTQPEPKGDAPHDGNGYDDRERRDINRLIEGKQ